MRRWERARWWTWTVLLLAVVLLWMRSRERAEIGGLFTGNGHLQALALARGLITLFLSDIPFRRERRWTVDWDGTPAVEFDDVRELVECDTGQRLAAAGFEMGIGKRDAFGFRGRSFLFMSVPHWFVGLVAGVALFRISRRAGRRVRWRQQGECERCGYDLRGEAGACPECGYEGDRVAGGLPFRSKSAGEFERWSPLALAN